MSFVAGAELLGGLLFCAMAKITMSEWQNLSVFGRIASLVLLSWLFVCFVFIGLTLFYAVV
jgi:hypothetical protein